MADEVVTTAGVADDVTTVTSRKDRKRKPKNNELHPIRAVHIRNLARRCGVQRLSNNAELVNLVRQTLLNYAQSVLEKMIHQRTNGKSQKVSFTVDDVESVMNGQA